MSSDSSVSDAFGSTSSLRKTCSRSSACARDSPTTAYAIGSIFTISGSRPAAGQMIEHREGVGHVELCVVGRRVRCTEPDRPRDAGDGTEHDAEVELHRTGTQAHGVGYRPAVDAGHGEPVVEVHQVEATLL